ncbi:uncharacterized protein LOC121732512 isoform X2 [Aricia agestis]|uniref:uncharacterized protein LOC121732512 isoform X2 n=1 Tax=Aricia agestis TaxID=91739 RepID=UPI001C20ABA6|nr:uncharacterized protein LOC121732512 isoform X2 [Aricia agestis]
MAVLWVILILSTSGLHYVHGFPINPSSRIYPQDGSGSVLEQWTAEGGLYAALPALALVFAAFGLLFGCTWCYRHKDCKPNEGAENQIFTASVTHLHDGRRSQPPDSGFSEPTNNNVNEDNNNGPISLREMQNIANNNAATYITSENEERNRISRESVVEFEPLPTGIGVLDPLERCADWFAGEDLPRDRLQYLREIGRGWFGRVVEGEIDDGESTTTVAVKILNQNASLEDKARFLDENKMYRDLSHENILPFVAKCLQEDSWLLVFELCSMDLQQYISSTRDRAESLHSAGAPLRLMCDVTSALAYMHANGYLYRNLCTGNILVRERDDVRAVLGQYAPCDQPQLARAPDTLRNTNRHTAANDVWALGHVIWELCAWTPPTAHAHAPPPPPSYALYGDHLYQVMQLCWNPNYEARPTAAQVHALINHLHMTHARASEASNDDGYGSSDFEERWQRLKPNSIPKIDEHVAIVHAPSTSMASHFTGSDQEFDNAPTIQDSLSVEMDTAVSRSSSIMSDKDLSVQAKSDSLTNLHGSLEDVRNIYLTHNEMATLECHQGNIALEEKDQDHSDNSVDPWLKDIINGSQDDVSYYRDVSDVIKNLDNILNSEKTSSSESSHQASPSRDNLSLECKKESPMQTSMVKSPGISNFKNILELDFDAKSDAEKDCEDDEGDADTIGTLSHSFERHSDTTSQLTLENITPETPIKDLDLLSRLVKNEHNLEKPVEENVNLNSSSELKSLQDEEPKTHANVECNNVPKLKELCVVSMPSVSYEIKDVIERDCEITYANKVSKDSMEAKSIENKIDLSNGIENMISCETNTDPVVATTDKLQEEISSNGNEETEVFSNGHSNDTENAVIDKFEEKVGVDVEEKLAENNCLPENFENKEKLNITNDIDESLLPEVILTPVKISTGSLQLNDPKNEELNITSELNNDKSVSETFIVNEVLASERTLENNHKSNSSTFLIEENKEEKDMIGNNKNQELNITQTLQNSHKDDVFQIIPSSVSNSSQASKSEMEKPFCEDLNKEIEKVKEYPNVSNSLESSMVHHNNIIINETFGIDESNALIGSSTKDIPTELPETVQNLSHSESVEINHLENKEKEIVESLPELDTSIKPEEQVQNIYKDVEGSAPQTAQEQDMLTERCEVTSDVVSEPGATVSCNSTAYMDLTDNKNKDAQNKIINHGNFIKYPEASAMTDMNSTSLNESTVYLDLPTLIKETSVFLYSERIVYDGTEDIRTNYDEPEDIKDNIHTSTPKGSEKSTESTLEPLEEETVSLTKVPVDGIGETFVKPKNASDNLSPFDSPTKSHPTDTYDENSSVVLGSLENCMFESLKNIKSDLVDIPKEELLAFSSNFSEINLETPSPLRDGNFLNEVPDIVSEDSVFEAIPNLNETKTIEPTENTSESEELSSAKRVSPLTPPNSPGNFLASTSQMKYLVDIDINADAGHVEDAVHLNQIDLQMTTKLAMAENENNLNIEYSGPLEAEDSQDAPECVLAGNTSSMDYQREGQIDEERMKELRNELELKLPLAQVSGIEPAEYTSPPPPELIVAYGALSPIAEETRLQLSAYENDDNWNYSVRTESSESYPEPCNNSTDDVTDLATGQNSGPNHSTYTVHSETINHTYTVPKEVPSSSKEITMSADSLNASPLKINKPNVQSPIDDKTYTKDDEKSNCERLSQISPFLVSPTDTSVPDNSDLAAVSTLSKTTVPTDAKFSKPSETQCLSKATSIDSWCSNDTLYNVEENFDDLAMDPDIPDVPELKRSDSEHTLMSEKDEKEHSHCSTYIVHDSKSECDTFSPDSITANNCNTYTKAKHEVVTPTITKSDPDSKNTQTKDLAYGTLMSGLPSYSNCTTELASAMDDAWKLPQPELVRRSPIGNEINFTPPRQEKENISVESPKCTPAPALKKMDSIEITCLKDSVPDAKFESPEMKIENVSDEMNESLNKHFSKNMAFSVTSTPCVEVIDDENVESVPLDMPQNDSDEVSGVPNFNVFFQSAEIRPQDISPNVHEGRAFEIEGESGFMSRESNRNVSEKTPTYSDFEFSAVTKPQEVTSKEKSSQSMESADGSEEFNRFQRSLQNCPQDLSSLIDASSLFIKSERKFSEPPSNLNVVTNLDFDLSVNRTSTEPESQIFDASRYNVIESHGSNDRAMNVIITDIDLEDENEQPHSIIVTESPLAAKLTPNRTSESHNDSDTKAPNTFHADPAKNVWNFENLEPLYVNSEEMIENIEDVSFDLKSSNSLSSAPQNEQTSIDVTINEDREKSLPKDTEQNKITCNGTNEVYATINIINEPFEELVESNVDDTSTLELKDETKSDKTDRQTELESLTSTKDETVNEVGHESVADVPNSNGTADDKMAVTEDFLQNEKKFCQLDSFFPLLSDIRFTGPASEIMSTSFTQDSPTEPTSPECEQDKKCDPSADILKEWDSDSDSHSTNSSSGEFIWKGGDGLETQLVPSTQFDHRDSNSQPSRTDTAGGGSGSGASDSGSGSGSGSEGDEVEFVPSSWDCRAAPGKSSLRSLENTLSADSKKRVVFKRQKYHCVYEYPREVADHSPAYLPDFSTYADWDAGSAEEAELGYQLFTAPGPLDVLARARISFPADYDDDFYISSSARPFELGVMSGGSQFFPGLHKAALRDFDDTPPSPAPAPPPAPLAEPLTAPLAKPLDLTTPDSGVEDITPGSLPDEDYKKTEWWRDPAEAVSPTELGGLRHTRDRLKLDLPPSPHLQSPRHARVFSFRDVTPPELPQATFSTFGKPPPEPEPPRNIVLTEVQTREGREGRERGEGTVLDSGDEDSGIESTKATLERDTTERDANVERSPNVS